MRISTAQIQRSGVNAIIDQQSKLSHTQLQLSTGKRILQASDDPAGAAKVLDLKQSISILERYQDSAGIIEDKLALEETTLGSVNDLLINLKELAIQGANGTQSSVSLESISSEVEQNLESILGLANTSDGTDYIFGGYQTATIPFSKVGNNYVYNGDQGQRIVEIGPNRQVVGADTGYDIFMDIYNGNGTFTTEPAATNTGDGSISVGSVKDGNAWVDDTYTVTFTETNGNITYTVTDSGANVIGVADTPFTDGDTISFRGIEFDIEGDPSNGDTFTVDSSEKQSVFETVEDLLTALDMPKETTADKAKFTSAISKVMEELNLAMDNINTITASVGARRNAVENEIDANSAAALNLEASLSTIQDLDYAETVSNYSLQMTSLEAAQQSFAKIQGLSLFNYM